jgi:TMEM199 family protein
MTAMHVPRATAPPSKITTLVVPFIRLARAMSRPPPPDNLSVSLEPHLIEILRPLVDTTPAPLSAELSPLLSETTSSSSSTPKIPYTLLLSISRWARTEEAARALRSKNPPLDPLAYNMVSLLAGTRTSPDKKFPQPSGRSENAARDISDRRAIIAVLNALLSVICTGAATWWAAQRTGWRDEWVG